MISLLVAVAQNGVMGREQKLPWHLPEDLKYFKKLTMGHPVVMGRKTYESIGKPLPGRRNLVISRQKDYAPEGVEVFSNLLLALKAAQSQPNGEIFILGGAEIFKIALPLAHRIYLTEVHAEVDGDVYFPEIPKGDFQEVKRTPAGAAGELPYSFVVLDRRQPASFS